MQQMFISVNSVRNTGLGAREMDPWWNRHAPSLVSQSLESHQSSGTQKVQVTQFCLTLCNPMDCIHGILQARILEWVAFSFSRGSSQARDWTQALNPDLLHCWRILYQLSHQGSPRILEWVACPFSSGSSRPRNQCGVSCIAGGFFTELSGKPYFLLNTIKIISI